MSSAGMMIAALLLIAKSGNGPNAHPQDTPVTVAFTCGGLILSSKKVNVMNRTSR